MVSSLESRSSGLGSSPDRGQCVVFLGNLTLYSWDVSLHLGVLMVTGEFNAGGTPAMNWHPTPARGGGSGVEILLVAPCYRHQR